MTSAPLWTLAEICAATGGRLEGADESATVSGISIDTRTLAPGDLFVPLSDKRDGHDFVDAAFEAGAAAALVRDGFVSQAKTARCIYVDDPLRALERLAGAARVRLPDATVVVAVTGSVGKTGTKDMLKAAFGALGETHAATKSFNNHWGVPLTLARTPRNVAAAIYEIGMNHAGEITPLTQMVQPDIAIVTTVEPVHLEFFDSVEQIAEAKAEIFSGLVPGGIAVLNADNAYCPLLSARAEHHGAVIKMFGRASGANVRLRSTISEGDRTHVIVSVDGQDVVYDLAIPGGHVACNSLAVVAALTYSGRDVQRGVNALSKLTAGAGRGAREVLTVPGGEILVLDESYNANPASMRAALTVLGNIARGDHPRRVAILGDMLELGAESEALHAGLAEAIEEQDIDLVFASGPHMKSLFARLPESKKGHWAESVEVLAPEVVAGLKAGDAVVIKGSLGSRMAHILGAIRADL